MKRTRSGAVMVLFACGLLTFISFLALVVDVGYLYAMKARMQAVVDGAAMAGAQCLDPSRPTGSQSVLITATVRRLLSMNGLAPARYRVEVRPESGAPSSSSIRVSGDETFGSFFSQALGWREFSIHVAASARTVAGPSGRVRTVLLE